MEIATPQRGQPVTVEVADGIRPWQQGLVEASSASRLTLVLGTDDASAAGGLQPGQELRVSHADERGLHVLGARVLALTHGERLRLTVELTGSIEQIQRRRFLRLGLQLPVSCALLDAHGQPREYCTAYTLEIGGNGASLVTDRPFEVGERLRFEVDLEGRGLCTAVAQVKRAILALRPGGAENRIALQFTEIDGRNQALLLSFLLAKQRERRAARAR